jgi:uroporphyrinogen decarboxylase
MTSRERLQTALDHSEPDRVPIIIGANNTTGIKMASYKNLKVFAGIDASNEYIYDWPELGTASVDEETLRLLQSDVRPVHDRFPEAVYRRNKSRPPHSPFIDGWGSGQIEIEEGVWMPGVTPLTDADSIDDIRSYKNWPDMSDPYRVAGVRDAAGDIAKNSDFGIMATPWLLFPFERAHAMMGLDNFLIKMSLDREFARELLNKNAELCKQLMRPFLRELGDNVDIIVIGDDLGGQQGLMISPEMYREILKPIHAEYISFIKNNTRAKVFFHTDGDVFDLIPDFIEIGVDILNPIQTSAGKMGNLVELKDTYGKDICFCGGIDTQRVLPFGTPESVRKEVERVTEIMGKGGGYMLAAVHTIMAEVPPENILAMVEAASRPYDFR